MNIIREGFGWGFLVVGVFCFWQVFRLGFLLGERGVWILFICLFPYKYPERHILKDFEGKGS